MRLQICFFPPIPVCFGLSFLCFSLGQAVILARWLVQGWFHAGRDVCVLRVFLGGDFPGAQAQLPHPRRVCGPALATGSCAFLPWRLCRCNSRPVRGHQALHSGGAASLGRFECSDQSPHNTTQHNRAPCRRALSPPCHRLILGALGFVLL